MCRLFWQWLVRCGLLKATIIHCWVPVLGKRGSAPSLDDIAKQWWRHRRHDVVQYCVHWLAIGLQGFRQETFLFYLKMMVIVHSKQNSPNKPHQWEACARTSTFSMELSRFSSPCVPWNWLVGESQENHQNSLWRAGGGFFCLASCGACG